MALDAIARAALAQGQVAQGAVVYVEGAWPEDVGRVYVEARQAGPGAELIAEFMLVEQAGIQRRGGQVVGGTEGVKIPGQVQVHLLHRHHLGVTASGGASLDTEHRPQARLAYGGDAGLAYVVEPHGEPEGSDRLALA
ncbi:hypothetical protein D3C79_923060 [compost metagenome]